MPCYVSQLYAMLDDVGKKVAQCNAMSPLCMSPYTQRVCSHAVTLRHSSSVVFFCKSCAVPAAVCLNGLQ